MEIVKILRQYHEDFEGCCFKKSLLINFGLNSLILNKQQTQNYKLLTEVKFYQIDYI